MRTGSSGPLQRLRRIALAASLTAALVPSTSPAAASETIGQLAPGSPPGSFCGFISSDFLQPTVTSGNPYVVPATVPNWTLTSWNTNASAGAGQVWAMKVFRQVADLTYVVVGRDTRALNPGSLNTFAASVPVRAGDVLGLNHDPDGSGASTACGFPVAGEPYLYRFGNLDDGGSDTFSSASGRRLNITAVVEPSNAFTLGAVKRNKRKGIAALTVNVPNPGELVLGGKGVKSGGSGAVIAKSPTAPGDVKLKIRAKGKKKRKLNRTGKVKLRPEVTFTPTGGDPSTQSLKLKLKKRVASRHPPRENQQR